jgi:hypothetical protein
LSNLEGQPTYPFIFDIEITLTRTPMDHPHAGRNYLEDVAYQPKTYRLQLEEGKFHVRGRTDYGCNPFYQHRMLWDKSPFPMLEEWIPKAKSPVMANKFWEYKDFYHGQMEEPGPEPPTATVTWLTFDNSTSTEPNIPAENA